MDCRDAEFYLRLRRPGADELGPEVTAALDRHLAGCPACDAAAARLGGFDAAVAAVMKAVPVPSGLANRLHAAVAARRGAAFRARTYRYAAAAATVLVAAGLALGIYSRARPTPDTDALVNAGDATADPEAAVARFLKAERLPELPEAFDPGLFVIAATEKVQGRDVPVIVFRDRAGRGWAKVYAFRDTAFDPKNVRDAQTSNWIAKAYPARGGVAFVVVFTGPDLATFLRGGANGPVL